MKGNKKRAFSQNHSDKEECETLVNSVSIVTPERRNRKNRREKDIFKRSKEERRNRRYDFSDDSQFEGLSPLKGRRRIEFADDRHLSSKDDLCSIEEEPLFSASIRSLQHMRRNYWSSFAGEEDQPDDDDNRFLRAVVGDCEKDLDRFLKWSKWSQDSHENFACTSISDYVRTVMLFLVKSDFQNLKKLVLFSDRSDLLNALRIQFGKLKRTLLHAFALHPRPDEVIEVLRFFPSQDGALINDKFGINPLQYLCLNSNLRKSSTLEILHRIVVDSDETINPSPLHLFTLAEHDKDVIPNVELSKALLFLHAKTGNSRGFAELRTPLMTAIMNHSSLRCVEYLLTVTPPDRILIPDRDGMTCLHIACAEGSPEICDKILSIRAIPEFLKMQRCSLQGSSPMHAAAAGGSPAHAACIKILLQKISSQEIVSNLKDNKKWPPLLYALFSGNMDCIKACLEADKRLIDPAWGKFPQLVFTLHVVVMNERMLKNSISRLLSLGDEFHVILNEFLETDISRLTGPLEMILEVPNIISLENKVRFLESRSANLTRERSIPAYFTLTLPTNRPVNYPAFLSYLREKVYGYQQGQKLRVQFINESVVSSGSGPTREFFSLLSQIVCEYFFAKHAHTVSEISEIAGWVTGVSLISKSRMDLKPASVLISRCLLECDIGEENMKQFRAGFFSAVPEEWVVNLFEQHELVTLLGDDQGLIVEEWRASTVYTGYAASDIVIQWFWEIVEDNFTEKERKMLLFFTTGMTVLPFGGFGNMQSIHGEGIPFTILRQETIALLPTSTTCLNLLRLPPYSSKAELLEKLTQAIRINSI